MLNSMIRSLSELSDSELLKVSSVISKELVARKAKIEVDLSASGHVYLGHSYETSETVRDNTLFWERPPLSSFPLRSF